MGLESKNKLSFTQFMPLPANANAGGDNVPRGMVLGLIVGAANDDLPQNLKQGLTVFDELQDEIDAFADVAVSGQAMSR